MKTFRMPHFAPSMIWGLAFASLTLTTSVQATYAQTDADLALVNRLTWGSYVAAPVSGGDLRSRDDDTLPEDIAARIAAMRINRNPLAQIVVEQQSQKDAIRTITDPTQKQAARRAYQDSMNALVTEARSRFILRALYSQDQMREQMTWFWFNHFNVQASKADLRAMVGDYENVIRTRSLGRFRDLLEATLRHPAMLRYLDNADNAAGKINENYAREIMELHTMGVDAGYSQQDVQELARILTGVGISLRPGSPSLKPALQRLYIRDGLFEFNPARHDFGDKQFLGHVIKGSGFDEVEQALDLIASSPATAHHVSQRIATYFVGDRPPPAMVDRMAQIFLKTDGDIAKVIDTMVRSPEFNATLGHAFKDPVHYVLSAVRVTYGNRVIQNTQPIIDWLVRMGEGLYSRSSPDGYDLASAAWMGPGQMAARFDIARQIGSGKAGLFRRQSALTPDTVKPSQDIVDLRPDLRDASYVQALLVTFGKPTLDTLAQVKSPQEWNAMFLSSPEFMRR